AGLPPVYGLYAAVIAPLIAAMWGSLQQLSTGPIAILSLLVLTTLSPLAEPGTARYIELALLLAFMVGVLYLAIGVFRLGAVMSFISHSTVRGFTSAAALIICATQIPSLLGINIQRHEYLFPMLYDIVKGLPGTHIPSLVIGLLAFAIIYVAKKYRATFPGGLVALILTTVPLVLFEWHERGIAIVGPTPAGLPHFQIPSLDFHAMSRLLGPAIAVALVSFAETYSVGKAISTGTKQKVDVNQEFIGQGLANLVGSFFQSYPVSGSFSRTAINFSAGAKTWVSSVAATLGVIIALLFLTPYIAYIPKSALSALVISAVMLLFNPGHVFSLWKKNRHDGIVALTVFALAVLTKPDYALLIGVVLSLVLFLWKTMHPRIVRITKDPEHNMFVNADVYQKPSCPQILELRPDNCIFFGNAEYTMEQLLGRVDEQKTPVKFLLLDFESIAFIDISGVDELFGLLDELKARRIEMAFLYVHLPVKKVLESTNFLYVVGQDRMLEKMGDAIVFIFQRLDHDYCRKVCPYKIFHECSTVK
ncbi:MAG: SulP family inorganic anion transporter, partial [Desulfobacterota bacterium]|nr:SulP family inorganic anion transporter [Thermodesulfobacteriota bacterium]